MVIKKLPDGRVVEVYPMTFGKGRITIGDGHTNVVDSW